MRREFGGADVDTDTASSMNRENSSDEATFWRMEAERYEVARPGEPQCEADGVRNGPDGPGGTEHYWTCTAPGEVDVEGTLMCEDHAGERGYGPKQEEYGFERPCGCTNPDCSGAPCGEGWR